MYIKKKYFIFNPGGATGTVMVDLLDILQFCSSILQAS